MSALMEIVLKFFKGETYSASDGWRFKGKDEYFTDGTKIQVSEVVLVRKVGDTVQVLNFRVFPMDLLLYNHAKNVANYCASPRYLKDYGMKLEIVNSFDGVLSEQAKINMIRNYKNSIAFCGTKIKQAKKEIDKAQEEMSSLKSEMGLLCSEA